MSHDHRALGQIGRYAGVIAATATLVVVAPTAATGSASAVTFGAPSGYSCSGTWAGVGVDATIGTGTYDNVPFDGWNGIPLSGFVDDPPEVRTGLTIPGPNCGDVQHGSTAFGPGASAATTFADTASSYTISALDKTTKNSAILTEATSRAHQEIVATQAPMLAPTDRTITASLTYTTSGTWLGEPLTNVAPGELDVGIAPADAGPLPSCSGGGEPASVTTSGNDRASFSGDHTYSVTYSCPNGESIASGPIAMTVNQDLLRAALLGGAGLWTFTLVIDNASITTG